MSAQKTKIRSSTQNFLQIKAIEDDLVILKNNCCTMIIKTTAINFGLLSEKEQEATIFAYAHFINSLAFPIQIVVHSRQKDISTYLELIEEYQKKQKNEKLAQRTQQYYRFIKDTVKKNKILDKHFFIVLQYTNLQLSKTSKKNLLEKAKLDLYPKRDHLIEQLQRIGLRGHQLNNKELVELFYQLYNPESSGIKLASPTQYASTLVETSKTLKPLTQDQKPAKQTGFKPISVSISKQQPHEKQKQDPKLEQEHQSKEKTEKQSQKKFNVLVPNIGRSKKDAAEGQALQDQLNKIVQKTKQQN